MLGLWRGAAMYVGAVLGPGVLVLPRLAAEAAGPASIAAWLALLVLSAPVAATFAMLGARYPGGGGVSGFVARAFGPRAAAVTGWWFIAAIPPGVAAGAKTGAAYVGGSAWVTVALLVAAFAANHAGLRLSGGAQLAMAGVLALLLVAACAVAAPHVEAGNFTPFAPHGAGGVAGAVGVLFLAFVGWEAATHLSGDFADPRRMLPRVAALSLAVVAVIYIGLSIVVVGALGDAAAREPAPLSALLRFGLGDATGPVTAVAALALSFGAVNAYLAGPGGWRTRWPGAVISPASWPRTVPRAARWRRWRCPPRCSWRCRSVWRS
ncbi:hypothetical protein Afil01_01400 [Actinorhabdospora filicis]|uniref:Amino acid permease n=1 Tax=Actinorhabdospora filicis TaxID=1785913 RepID=A0A9W6SFG0_9ACTN|nr:amino acid permease [Actinorhabdospora filicis]GLZ75333.1 hypothetical protein Afil01_01400 [Actinorhabdospora filicis]